MIRTYLVNDLLSEWYSDVPGESTICLLIEWWERTRLNWINCLSRDQFRVSATPGTSERALTLSTIDKDSIRDNKVSTEHRRRKMNPL